MKRAAGFTFIEVLVALVVLGTLAAATASTLIASFRAEETAERLEEARLLLETLFARHMAGRPVVAADGREGDWEIRLAPARHVGQTGTEWRVVTIYPADRPSLNIVTAHRLR